MCLSDYVSPVQNGRRDHTALFVVTAGEGTRDRTKKAKNDGYYFKSHGLQALAIETAEGCAEYIAESEKVTVTTLVFAVAAAIFLAQ